MVEFIFVYLVVVIMLSGGVWQYNNEKREWNNGICPHCGGKWKCFDMDSQGGRGYNCNLCNKYTWISYWVDSAGEVD